MEETSKSMYTANKYPKNLETFILLEKMKEQSANLKKVGEQVEKLSQECADNKMPELESYDYMEPVPLTFPDFN